MFSYHRGNTVAITVHFCPKPPIIFPFPLLPHNEYSSQTAPAPPLSSLAVSTVVSFFQRPPLFFITTGKMWQRVQKLLPISINAQVRLENEPKLLK